MNLIATLCPVEDILLGRDIANKSRLFDDVARHLQERHGLPSAALIDSLNAREALGSTAVGHGLAIPHARIAGLQKVVAVFVRPRTPIAFDAPDRKPVSDILVLLVPEQAQQEHLQILASIAQMFSDRPLREQLRAATNAAEVSRLFSQWQAPG
ncbi:PTS system nitrogen regulatory IIA component [Herbaspirillum sp. Sphag1AN]|uniref:PTS sugar transporter subunit IIA n=1 Tax=unclassified Herbaspirillum TaxID=2624150 RepID=UPI00161A778B|nr:MULTISPECIES: PTS sugar transporter subunit IIA [unclassified Herbaspirillum]MBB3214529.1 PTS system nitrogen regulatory IIA component [Herbaspirillum sp. Sphag1AN]MBB3247631.1 PTS system nitrogen regulatory IIA component [Herbaspirillum sp. Sphag64]